jgi:uncharacterized FlaG/YvyC family protein
MRVALELRDTTAGAASGTPTVRNSQPSATGNDSSATDVATATDATASVSQAAAVSPEAKQHSPLEQVNLSFRKDTDGSVYYVVTDEQSGKVIREVPAEAVRHVSDGIAQYLQAEAALRAPKTDTKA